MKKRLHYLCKDGVENLSLVMPNGDLQYEFFYPPSLSLQKHISKRVLLYLFQLYSIRVCTMFYDFGFSWTCSFESAPIGKVRHNSSSVSSISLPDSHFIINHRALITESALSFPDIAERSFLHIRALIFMITNISRSIHYTLYVVFKI